MDVAFRVVTGSVVADADGHEQVEINTALAKLAALDPTCYYQMVDAIIRRHASQQAWAHVLQDTGLFIHPYAPISFGEGVVVVGGSSSSGGSGKSSSSGSSGKVDSKGSSSGGGDPSSSSSGGSGSSSSYSRTGAGVLSNWKQTQAFLSALLSYRKVLIMLRGVMPPAALMQMELKVASMLDWLDTDDLLNKIAEGICGGTVSSSSSHGGGGTAAAAAGGGGGPLGASEAEASSRSSSSSHVDAAAGPGPAADPEEADACRILAVCVLSRLMLTCCEQLALTRTITTESSSSSTNMRTPSAMKLGSLGRLDLESVRNAWVLGLACYSLLKQLCDRGSMRTTTTSSSITTSSCMDTTRGSSSSRGSRTEPSKTPAASVAGAATRKWNGLQLELPAPVLELLHKAEPAINQCLREDNSIMKPKAASVQYKVQLLIHLLPVCEEVIAAVPLPLGCNNPRCVSLTGMSEAAAAKVCSGCHKVHYCSPECIKAHWKEHKPYCKRAV